VRCLHYSALNFVCSLVAELDFVFSLFAELHAEKSRCCCCAALVHFMSCMFLRLRRGHSACSLTSLAFSHRLTTLNALCDAYKDPSTGENLCKMLNSDSRCNLKSAGGLQHALAGALGWLDMAADEQDALKGQLCGCSCLDRIVEVYTPLLWQWGMYDEAVAASMVMLSSEMCFSNIASEFVLSVSELSSVQCASNELALSITPNHMMPAGTLITITGQNAIL
jgi:hypothetical protein